MHKQAYVKGFIDYPPFKAVIREPELKVDEPKLDEPGSSKPEATSRFSWTYGEYSVPTEEQKVIKFLILFEKIITKNFCFRKCINRPMLRDL